MLRYSDSYVYVFEWPEMRMLADAVASSQFISPTKSRALIRKLASLTSKPMSRRLTSNYILARF